MADSSKSPPLTVPGPGDPDRKRALNVLAQRRYRQRRREKIQGLERRLRSSATVTASHPSPPPVALPFNGHQPTDSLGIATTTWSDFFDPDLSGNLQIAGPLAVSVATSDLHLDLDDLIHSGVYLNTPPQDTSISYLHGDLGPFFTPISLNGDYSAQSQSQAQAIPINEELQALEASQFTFPDDNILEVQVLSTLRAGLNIASTLGCTDSIWDLSILRTFTTSQIPSSPSSTSTSSSASSSPSHLPANLIPTAAQQLIPHHALFDLFPWPAVRTRLICVFAQPPHARPPNARDPDAVMRMLGDVDDEDEGVRVSGSDCFDARNWEVGQLVFENWWWAFDREVVDNSNALRRRRGRPRLMLAGAGGAGGGAS